MKRIGILTCKKRLNNVEDDLIIRDYLNKNGYIASIVAWDDSKVEWTNYDILFIRSVWNSSVNYRKYCEFLLLIQNLNIIVINGVNIIIDNMCKKQLKGIKHGIFINKTYSVFKSNVIALVNKLSYNDLVLKPMIGESSYHVFKYNKKNEKSKNTKGLNYIIKKIYKDYKKYGNPGVLIERYNDDILLGEYCVFYFNKKILYCIKKYPSVFQKRKEIEIVKNIPNKIIKYINDNNLIDSDYGRIDLLYNKNVYLMEIEKNDPDLFLKKLNNEIREKVLQEILIMICRCENE